MLFPGQEVTLRISIIRRRNKQPSPNYGARKYLKSTHWFMILSSFFLQTASGRMSGKTQRSLSNKKKSNILQWLSISSRIFMLQLTIIKCVRNAIATEALSIYKLGSECLSFYVTIKGRLMNCVSLCPHIISWRNIRSIIIYISCDFCWK